jgi:hypothetical protein
MKQSIAVLTLLVATVLAGVEEGCSGAPELAGVKSYDEGLQIVE